MEQQKYANMQRYKLLMELAPLRDDWLLRGSPQQGQVSQVQHRDSKSKPFLMDPTLNMFQIELQDHCSTTAALQHIGRQNCMAFRIRLWRYCDFAWIETRSEVQSSVYCQP